MKKRILSTILAVALTATTALAVLPTTTASAQDLPRFTLQGETSVSQGSDRLAPPKIVNCRRVSPECVTVDWEHGDISYATNPNISYVVVLSGQLPIYTTDTHVCIYLKDKAQTGFVVTRYKEPGKDEVFSKLHSEPITIPAK